MDIKIKCTHQEFIDMIRHCALTEDRCHCTTCVLLTEGGCEGIENIASIEVVEDGACNG